MDETSEKPPRLYVLVRANMSRRDQAVQAGHGVAAFVQLGSNLWFNRTLIYLRVKDEAELLEWRERFHQMVPTAAIAPYADPSWGTFTSVAIFGSPEVQ